MFSTLDIAEASTFSHFTHPFLFIYFISTEFNSNADTSDRNLFKNQYQLGSCEGTDVKYQNQNNNLINMSSFKKKYLHRDRF